VAVANDTPVRGRSSRLFAAGAFLFVVLFVAFAVLLILSNLAYIDRDAVVRVLTARFIRDALWLSLWTSTLTTLIAVLFAVPMGYALSRYRFPGHVLVDTIVDLPIVFPPLVAGMTLLVFFAYLSDTEIGRWMERNDLEFIFQPRGIVLCQFVVTASFAIRSTKTAFDEVDRRLENVALTLGCTQWSSFRRVSLPLAMNGVITGAILTWARAFGTFGPLMIFVGAFRGRTEVLSSTIYLEQSVGNLEVALAVALLLIGVALVCLMTIRLVGGRALVKL
jgi:molybdate transport system permease protein